MKSLKRSCLSLSVAIMMLILAACTGKEPVLSSPSSKSPSSSITSSVVEATLPTKDRAGNDITVPKTVNKIISMAPATTQLLCDLGLQDKIIAIDTNSKVYVTGINKELPEFDMMTPDAEAMIVLKPDIVFVSGISSVGGTDPFKALKDIGVCVADIPSSSSIEDVKKDVKFTADCLGKSEEVKTLLETMQKEIDEIAAIGKTITDRKTVLFEIAAAPSIYSFGKNTFLQEMLEIIGAENVLADQESWVSVTEEAAVGANPDVILTNVNYIEDPVGEIKGRSGWENVNAVKNGQVYAIDNGASSLPNQHIVDALKQMAKAIYPEQYTDITDPFAKS